VDIAPEVADNATMAFEAERAAGKSAKGYKLAKSHGKAEKSSPVSLVKARVPRNAAKAKPRRKNDN
jgi:membrane-bound lytic murein transglycosylase D